MVFCMAKWFGNIFHMKKSKQCILYHSPIDAHGYVYMYVFNLMKQCLIFTVYNVLGYLTFYAFS